MRQRNWGWEEAHTSCQVQLKCRRERGQERGSRERASPQPSPPLALSDFSPDLSGTRQGLAARVPRGP